MVKKNVPSKFSYALLQILSCELPVMQPDVLPSVTTGSTPSMCPGMCPYKLPVRGVNNPDHCRDITKLLFLLGFNASDEQSLFKAFRSELDYTAYPYSFPDDVLSELLDGIKDRHPKISHLTCSGAGLRLMNLDLSLIHI